MHITFKHIFINTKLSLRIKLCFLCTIVSISVFAQQCAYIDFGGSVNITDGNWNNVVVTNQNETGLDLNLIDDSGTDLGILLTLTDSFDFINSSGTTNPNTSLPFKSSATKDSFFGTSNSNFNGNINPTGGFTLSNLDADKFYSFSIFSSRVGVSDNRETLYTATGSTINSQTLNSANNISNTAKILNIQPKSNGKIIVQAEPGSNNNNSNGFYYLGAIKLVISDVPIDDITTTPELTLIYPKGNNIWEVNKIVRIKWESVSISDILVEFSINNGDTWNTLGSVSSNQQYYDISVPNQISSQCLIRISSDGLTDTSDAVFETIPNKGTVYKIIVLGSSTAAGSGPSNIDNAWVWSYKTFLNELDTRYQLVNLAKGGFTTYNILPTSTTIPNAVNRSINVERNITKAIDLNANGIIINLPSNDAASGYSISDQLNNYQLIGNESSLSETSLWVTTPQPRNFGSNTSKLNIQLGLIDETYNMFGNKTIDFWTGFGLSNGNGILPIYNSGDGVHMNDDAHQILYERVVSKNIHTQVKNSVDSTLGIRVNESNGFSIFPNPTSSIATIKFPESFNGKLLLTIYNVLGTEVEHKNYEINKGVIHWRKKIPSGIYIMNISYKSKLYKQKLIIN